VGDNAGTRSRLNAARFRELLRLFGVTSAIPPISYRRGIGIFEDTFDHAWFRGLGPEAYNYG
jgi:hypothetical protein